MKATLKSSHLWAISLVLVLLGLSYYGDSLSAPDWVPLGKQFFSRNYVHDVHRALFLIPMLYTAWVFRLRGALVISALVFCIIIPRGLSGSPNPDPLLRSLIFTFVASLATLLVGLERQRAEALTAEVTNRRQAEGRIAHLNAVLRAIRHINHLIVHESDAGRLLQRACDSLVETRGYHHAWIALVDTSGNFTGVFGAGLETDFAAVLDKIRQEGLTTCARQALNHSHVLTMGDSTGCGDCPLLPSYEEQGEMSVRLEHGGKVYGVLSVSVSTDQAGDEEENALFKEVADDLAFALFNIERNEEHRSADEALTLSESRYRSLFDNASNAIYVRDIDGNILMANRAMADLIGHRIDELTRLNISDFFPDPSLQIIRDRQQTLLNDETRTTSDRYEAQLIRKDGTERTVEVLTSLLAREGHTPTFQAILLDVTEQRRSQENMRAYTIQITRAQEEERKRISRELHDDTAQSLVSLGLDIDYLIRSHKELPDEVVQQLEGLHQKTGDTLKGLRRFSQDLRPPMLEELGLIETLQWLIDNLGEQMGINARLASKGSPAPQLSHEAELLIFRIVQEALNNIRKHSGATDVRVELEFAADTMKLTIRDNGSGFDQPEAIGNLARIGKLGLVGMRERARLLGGDLKVESEVGKGTTVTVEARIGTGE